MSVWLGLAGALVLTFGPLWSKVGNHLVTVVHEAGHALVAGAISGGVSSVRIDSSGGGETTWTNSTGADVPVSLAGYLAPSGVGLGALALLNTRHVLGALVLMLAALAILLVLVRNAFGIAVVLVAGAVLCLALLQGSAPVQSGLVAIIAWTLLFGAVRTALILFGVGPGSGSDSHVLARATMIPAIVWSVLFLVGTSAAAAYAVWLTVGGG